MLCNRGANGIDGTVSSAFGAAAAAAGRVVLLIGDVALAHDIGGLLAARRLGLKLTIVLLDNGGGGIFDFLPVADAASAASRPEPPTTSTRATSRPRPGLDFARAAALYGLAHERAEDVPASARRSSARSSASGSSIVEVRSDREGNVALHRRVWRRSTRSLAERRSAQR